MEALRSSSRSISTRLDDLGPSPAVRSHGERLIALAIGAHSVAIERLIGLAADAAPLEADEVLAEVLWMHRPAPTIDSLDGLERRIGEIVAAISGSRGGEPDGADATATRLLDEVTELYGAAMARAIDVLHRTGQHSAIHAAMADEVVSAALVMLGMHPDDLATRVSRAIERLAVDLAIDGPQPVLVGVDSSAVVRLRIEGEPKRDRWRVGAAVERAVTSAAPDASEIVVEGAADEPGHRSGSHSDEVFIPLSSLRRRHGSPEPSRWIELTELVGLGDRQLVQVAHDDLRLLACRVGPDLYVALDPFTGDGLALHIAEGEAPVVEAPTGARFVFADPLPVMQSGDHIEVAVP